MQFLILRLWIEIIAAIAVLQVFASGGVTNAITTLAEANDATRLGVATASVLVVSGPVELVIAVIRYFRKDKG